MWSWIRNVDTDKVVKFKKVFESFLNVKYIMKIFKYEYFSFLNIKYKYNYKYFENKYLNTFKYKCIWPHPMSGSGTSSTHV